MSNVGYDLDTSGGLMPLIRALIKPPDEDSNGQKNKKPQHPYYKRPGKGHNHDSCDACGEGGDLICCDRCPASFHLGCYDPPFDENDIPAGLWLCKECRASDAEKPASSRSSRAQSPADNKSDTERKTRSLRNSRVSTSTKKQTKEDVKEDESPENPPEEDLSPMEVLVKAARIMNPKQFELPPEMRVPCLFPGTEKDVPENSKNGAGSVVTVDSSGSVPLPAKTCYVCAHTCKVAPLLQCDYCPLLFHQDCLDPPLTALPTGRWMCPNHVEQYIDWKLVNSISATERVALWDKFSGPVDQHAIKLDFIRRARNARPAFRMKVPVGVSGRVMVPDMVKYHYKHPPPLQPSRREYVRCINVIKSLQSTSDYELSDTEPEAPKHKICMNLDCELYKGGECPHDKKEKTDGKTGKEIERVKQIGGSQDEEKETKSHSSDTSDSEADYEFLTAPLKRKLPNEGKSVQQRAKKTRVELSEGEEGMMRAVEGELSRLDDRLVKVLAWQRLQQVLAGEQYSGPWRRVPLGRAAQRLVARALRGGGGAARGGAAWGGGGAPSALPSQLLPRNERERIARLVWGSPPRGPGAAGRRGAGELVGGRAAGDATVIAVLCPINGDLARGVVGGGGGVGGGVVGGVGVGGVGGGVVAMRSSRLTVGSRGCDAELDDAACRRVAPHHATIFCDEVTGHFELINYAECGSLVNGVLYASDASERAEWRGDASTRAVRSITQARDHAVISLPPAPCCRCPSPPGGAGGGAAWEGGALLPHGALLQFGCQQFVFSIIDKPVASDDDDE